MEKLQSNGTQLQRRTIVGWLADRSKSPDGSDCSSRTTLTTLPLAATIYYPFHPYANQSFAVLQRSAGKTGRLTLVLAQGKTLAVPIWMLDKAAASIEVDTLVVIQHTRLLELVDLLDANCFSLESGDNNLEPLNGSAQF